MPEAGPGTLASPTLASRTPASRTAAPTPVPEILIMGPLPMLERRLEPIFAIHRYWAHADKDAFLAQNGPRIRGIATYSGASLVDSDLLGRLPAVGVIANMGAGYETIDVAACRARGIIVTNAGGVNAIDVAEHAFGLILAVARDIVAADRYVRAGRWTAEGRMGLGRRLGGRKLGILGLGNIGLCIARLATAFGMPVFYHNRRPVSGVPYTYVETVEALARTVDVLAIAAPGGAETRHLVDRAVIDALGPAGILVNVGRGSVVDEAALIDALVEGRLGGAGLDVFETEPVGGERFPTLPNLVLQPHIAGATREAVDAAIDTVVGNMRRFFAGDPVSNRVA
jgi:lactate dehydrogenase-like 2-hydroxyacid dehydrogenase